MGNLVELSLREASRVATNIFPGPKVFTISNICSNEIEVCRAIQFPIPSSLDVAPAANDLLESAVEAAVDDEVHDAVEDEEQVVHRRHAH